ncbi:MAG: acyltransferase [Myxococcaceae bacterium]
MRPPSQLLSRLKLWRCASVGASPRVLGRVWIHGGGRPRLGDRVVLDGRRAPIELHTEHGAILELGDDVQVEGGVSIEAQQSVVIGAGSRVGAFSKVLDNHFHPVRGDRTRRPPSLPVHIDEGVDIGPRAIVLPGARIEKGATIAPGVVVSRRVPAGTRYTGATLRNLGTTGEGP